jgi:hypothetical protein
MSGDVQKMSGDVWGCPVGCHGGCPGMSRRMSGDVQKMSGNDPEDVRVKPFFKLGTDNAFW